MNRKTFISILIVIFALTGTAVVAGAASDTRVLHSVPTAPTAPAKGAGNNPMAATGSGFSYQGRLTSGGSPANGQFDLVFNLYDALSGGNLIAGPVTVTALAVTDGLFTVSLDFGAGAFSGDARWLDIAVRPAGNGSYTPLTPRQSLSAAPYALSLMPGAAITSTLAAPLVTLSNTLGAGIYTQSETNNGVTGISNSSIASGVYGENFNSGYGMAARNNSTNPNVAAIYGQNVLTGTGVLGSGGAYGVIGSGGNGTGVYGTGLTYGVRGISNAASGTGGYFTSSSGTGVYAQSVTGIGLNVNSSSNYGLTAYTTTPLTSTAGAIMGQNNGAGYGVKGSSNGGYALYGLGSGSASVGVYGAGGAEGGYFTSTLGYGVYGITSSSNTGVSGVYGASSSLNGKGIIGESYNGTSAIGVWGKTTAGTGVRGDSGSASGVAGYSGSGYGVYGNSTSLPGVGGFSTNTYGVYGSGGTWGVYGISGNIYAGGVYGTNTSGHGYGVYALGGSVDGIGLYGTAGGTGVYGIGGSGPGVYATGGSNGVEGHTNNPIASGVYGDNSGGGYGIAARSAVTGTAFFADNLGGLAGNFRGNVAVQGTLSKGGGSFKIDNPVDPQNQYLYHSFVESPDMMNIYNGNVTLNSNGEATVKMPAWFEALNMEFRYQLTAMGAPGPNLYVAEEIKDNQFKIAGGKPGSRVSWQVTGIRHDPFANAHRIPVEENKPPADKGKYLYPTEQGKPASQGIGYEQSQQLARSAASPQAPAQAPAPAPAGQEQGR